MQDLQLFEYAIIRVIPRVEREEFINVGIILYCAKKKYLKALYDLDEERLTAFSPTADFKMIKRNLESLKQIAAGGKDTGPIGQLDFPSRFRWLTAMRSTVIQTSRVHPGLCSDPELKLQFLLQEQVY